MNNRILYIEDNPVNLQLIRRMVKAMNCELLEALDSFTGLQQAEQRLPNLILLDINMPDLSGFDVIHQLKMNPELQDIPVVALTADTTNYRECVEAGFDAYLNKPISTFALMRTIQQYLD